jgi:hypothetical protein
MSTTMSDNVTQPKPGTFRAICDECGQVRRTTSRPGYGKTGDWRAECPRCMVPLKCSHCGIRTMHAYIRDFAPASYVDASERRNIELTIEWEQYLRQEAFMVDLFEQMGIPIRTVTQITRNGEPAIYEVTRYVRDSEVVWEVVVLDNLTTVGRVYALCGVWESMTAGGVARWSDPDAYSKPSANGWLSTGSFQPIGKKTHHENKPLFLDEDTIARGAERQR